MGKKKWQFQQFGIYSFILISIAVFYQNCSDIRVSTGHFTSTSNSTPPPPDSPDTYDYKIIDSSTMPGGGMEASDWQVDGAYWFDNFIYGDPGFRSCSVFNLETAQMENKGLLVVTGEEMDLTDKKGNVTHVKTPFELDRSLVDIRHGWLGTQSVVAFRIYIPPDTKATQGTIDAHKCCVNNALPDGLTITISRQLCDFRERAPAQKIYTQDYCTIGNTVQSPMDIMAGFEIAQTPTGKKPCSLQPGYYYYVNMLTGHFDLSDGSILNGVLSLRSN